MPPRQVISLSTTFVKWAVTMATALYNNGAGSNYDPRLPGQELDYGPGLLDDLGMGDNDRVTFANNLLLFLKTMAGTLQEILNNYEEDISDLSDEV